MTYAERHPSAVVHGDRVLIEGRDLDETFWSQDPEEAPTAYRKTATVLAMKVEYAGRVTTPEGEMNFEPGDYLVTDDPPTHAEPVPGHVFEATYVPSVGAPAVSDADEEPDQQRGIYGKYRVERIGGTPGKHNDCFYYVLDLEHDAFARPALGAYAEACRAEYPQLADDLERLLGRWVPDREAVKALPPPETRGR